jgi:hypothetical protein
MRMVQSGSWSRADGVAFEGWLSGIGIEHQELDDEETAALRSRWRRAYAPGHHDKGAARFAFEFETFAHGNWPSLKGPAALRAFGAQREVRYYVLPDPSLRGMPAYRCSSVLLPTFQGDDLIVCAIDLSWTMAFTHDDGKEGSGPFFARANEKPG